MKTTEILAYGYGRPCFDDNAAFICGGNLIEIWDHDFPEGSTWTVCLRKRTPKGRRPYKEAIKVDVPVDFAKHGIKYELDDGSMSPRKLLVSDTDVLMSKRNLIGEFWVWVEVDV
jgi:hypothetical protein